MNSEKFNYVINVFPKRIKNILFYIPDEIKKSTYEIRLRVNKPVVLFGNFGTNFVKNDSTVSSIDSRYALTVDDDEMKQTISSICGYSVYSHQDDMAKGFVTFGDGHRVGFCGTAVMNENCISALRDIDSVNIRISRFFSDAADDLLNRLSKKHRFNGIIIAGAPCTGKTTVLRSFASKISSAYGFGYMKTVLIDERNEMGINSGINCDVLRSFSKSEGITHAIRVLSPEIIICDEVASLEEADKIIRGCYSGVKFVVSVHIGEQNDIFQRAVSNKLVNSGFFDYVVFLSDCSEPGKIKNIYKTEDLKNEYYCNYSNSDELVYSSVSSNT